MAPVSGRDERRPWLVGGMPGPSVRAQRLRRAHKVCVWGSHVQELLNFWALAVYGGPSPLKHKILIESNP